MSIVYNQAMSSCQKHLVVRVKLGNLLYGTARLRTAASRTRSFGFVPAPYFPGLRLHVFSHFARNGLFSRVSKGVGIHQPLGRQVLGVTLSCAASCRAVPHRRQDRGTLLRPRCRGRRSGAGASQPEKVSSRRPQGGGRGQAHRGLAGAAPRHRTRLRPPRTHPHRARCQWEKDQLAKFAQEGKQPPKGWQRAFIPSPLPDPGGSFNSPEEWAWTTVEIAGEVRLGRQRLT